MEKMFLRISHGEHKYMIHTCKSCNALFDLIRPDKVIWHGSHKHGNGAMDNFCDAWHSSSADRYGLGSPLSSGKLLEEVQYSCNNKFALLCIEVASEHLRKRRSLEDNLETGGEYVEMTQEEYEEHLKFLMKN